VSWTQAEEDVNTIEHRLKTEYPASELPEHVLVVALTNVATGQYQFSLCFLLL
jgi:hypothetical protein